MHTWSPVGTRVVLTLSQRPEWCASLEAQYRDPDELVTLTIDRGSAKELKLTMQSFHLY
mgnify:CR=1 FL=1